MPRTGRPKTGNAKEAKIGIRLSDQQSEKLEYCCKTLGVTRTEVITLGIDKVYEEVKQSK